MWELLGLDSSVADDADRLARFRREAQVLASLNHPNIAHIHGLEDFPVDGGSRVRALVMELVEGHDLSVLIARGPMPLDEALPIARQIADALEAAHEQGIIHRDLKPANIKVRPDGTVKVLDFGLAKAMDPAGTSSANAMNSPTLSIHATQAGMILGTAAYMSPEQARGRFVDRRADIWAFGAVFFEMLTGRRAFEGETVSDTLACVLKTDPAWTAVPDGIPLSLRGLLRRCLEKDPKRRLQAIGEARIEIEQGLSGAAAEPLQPVPEGASRKAILIASIGSAAGMAAVLTAVFFAMSGWHRAPHDGRSVRFTMALPAGATWMNATVPDLALAPDGSRLAFVATADGTPRVWVRSLDALTAQALPGTEGARGPFWSSDGRFIGFTADGKLKRIELAGASAPRTIAPASTTAAGTWNAAGVILIGSRTGLYRVADSGGEPVRVVAAQGSDSALLWPQFLPDGRHFLYTVSSSDPARKGVFIGSLDSTATTRLMNGDSNAAYAAPGYLLYARNATLMAQRFDLERLAVSGEAFPIAEGIVRGLPFTYAAFSVSQNGSLAYRSGESDIQQLTWFDRSGKPVGTLGPPAESRVPVLSLSGEKLAIDRVDSDRGTRDAWVIDVARGYDTRLTSHPANDYAPLLSPDGTRVVFASDRDGPDAALYQKSSTGDGPEELLLGTLGDKRPLDWSPDGKQLMFGAVDGVWLLPMSGERQALRVTPPGAVREWHPRFSPDGQWIVYDTKESGRAEVYVKRLAGGVDKSRISAGGGWAPYWSADGREIFYLTLDGTLVAVLFAPPAEAGSILSSVTVVLGWDAAVKR
jgi:Tol biopolymer transport system component